MFVRTANDRYKPISGFPIDFTKGDRLVYMEDEYFTISHHDESKVV